MFSWSSFPFLRITLFLSFGILASFYLEVQVDYPALLIILALLISVTFLTARIKWLLNFLILVTICFIGFVSHQKASFKDHLDRSQDANALLVQSELKLKKGYRLYHVVSLVLDSSSNVFSKQKEGYLYLLFDHLTDSLMPGTVYISDCKLEKFPGPKNPFEFDYEKFQNRKDLHFQAFVTPENIHQVGRIKLDYLTRLRNRIVSEVVSIIKKSIRNDRESGLFIAMILGEKTNLDSELKTTYQKAGISHILAVSGLHVGIIYSIINLILGSLIGTRFRSFKVLFVSIVLIAFAWITDFSPSVVRAVAMAIIYSMHQIINRKSPVLNSIGVAAFFILVFDPWSLFDLGFQLSFLAVLGIVLINPILSRQFKIENRLLKYLQEMCTVSLSAQIGILPLSLYYFGSTPVYFLLFNLFAIPGAFFILTGGFVLLLLGILQFPFIEQVGRVLELFTYLFNEMVELVHTLPTSTIENIPISFSEVLYLYLASILIISGIVYRSFNSLFLGLLTSIAFLVFNAYFSFQLFNQSGAIVYSLEDNFMMDLYKSGKYISIIEDRSNLSDSIIKRNVFPFRNHMNLEPMEEDVGVSFNRVGPLLLGSYCGKNIGILVDPLDDFKFEKTLKLDYLIVTGKNMRFTSQLSNRLACGEIILSSSVPTWLSKEIANGSALKIKDVRREGYWQIEM